MKQLEALIVSAEFICKLVPLDCCVMICDETGTIVKFVPAATFDMKVHVGTGVAKGGSLGECMSSGKEANKVLDKSLYGVPIKAVSIPVYEEGRLVGGIAIGISLENQHVLMDAVATIAATSEQITATSEELASTATTLASELDKAKQGTQNVVSEIGKTNDILKFVSEVAENSNLLGLNAAIEAARAGESGRGFAVVAQEIRKMAENSSKSVNDIRAILQTIQAHSSGITKTVSEAATVAKHQAESTEQITSAIQQLAASAGNVEKIAQII